MQEIKINDTVYFRANKKSLKKVVISNIANGQDCIHYFFKDELGNKKKAFSLILKTGLLNRKVYTSEQVGLSELRLQALNKKHEWEDIIADIERRLEKIEDKKST